MDVDEILEVVQARSLLRNVQSLGRSEQQGALGFEGILVIGDCEAKVLIDLRPPFPLRLPGIYLSQWDSLGYIPHVLNTGLVCYQDREGLVLDFCRPAEIVVEALGRAIRVLEDGMSGRNRFDFVDEFDVYWRRHGGERVFCMLDPPDQIAEVVLCANGESFFVAQATRDLAKFFNKDEFSGCSTVQKVLYIPLQRGSLLIPPRPDKEFWTVEDIQNLIWPLLSLANSRKLLKLLKRPPRTKEMVFFGLPRPAGGINLFGIYYLGGKHKHPLLPGGHAKEVKPITVRRLDKSYLVPRGGGDLTLSKKRVLVVGLGAVGGHIPFEMARAGILNFTLVDPDDLDPENTFRHALGRGRWWEKKAEALKATLESQFPYVRVRSVVEHIEQALEAGTVCLDRYDLVVLALGNPTVELCVNALAKESGKAPPMVFTWLEPFGIGGHALLTNNSEGGGCFQCLYTSNSCEPCEYLANRASFAAPSQSFGISLTGCGSLHTPYGSVAALQTAALSTRLAIDALAGFETGNPLRSWKGDSRAFLEAGFCLSSRYDLSLDDLANQAYHYVAPDCRVCNPNASGKLSVRYRWAR